MPENNTTIGENPYKADVNTTVGEVIVRKPKKATQRYDQYKIERKPTKGDLNL